MSPRVLLLGVLVAALLPATAAGEAPQAPPETSITSGPAPIVRTAVAAFAFVSSQESSHFACALDSGAFDDCETPLTISVPDGKHHFYVVAINHGDADPTPAVRTWTVDTTAPTAFARHRTTVGYRRFALSWGAPAAAGADRVVLLRSTREKQEPALEVYRGSGSSYVDTKFRNGIYHRYRIVSFDRAGNTSPPVDVVVDAAALLLAPRDGARVHKAPALRWRTAPYAGFYNVQLFRNGTKVLSAWPRSPELKLSSSWTYRSKKHQLARGRYLWFVWPGFGSFAQGRYGSLLGRGSFVVA
jgi:hypothetical protein